MVEVLMEPGEEDVGADIAEDDESEHHYNLISDEKARWKTTFTQKWCAPCQVDSEKTKTFYQEFHRRHAFESLPVTLVVVKIEIKLDCRNQIVTRSKLSEIVHFGFENCCSIVRSKRANAVLPYDGDLHLKLFCETSRMPSPAMCAEKNALTLVRGNRLDWCLISPH